jgi:acetyl esterase/lipase
MSFIASAGASAGAAAAAAIAQAIKASGVIVHVEPEDFLSILERQPEVPLVVQATSKFFFTTYYLYLNSYKGLAFYTKSPTPLALPTDCEIVQAKKIWIPG